MRNSRFLMHSFRCFSTTTVCCKQIPNNLKGKSVSSQQWLTRQLNDEYVKKARYANYRARSAFKLIEIDDMYKILHPGMIVVDLGAAPGAFTQVIVERLRLKDDQSKNNGMAIAVDLNAIHPIEGAHIFPGTDFTKPLNQGKILELLGDQKVDFVCSDMAPNATGDKTFDHDVIITLCYTALRFAVFSLKPKSGCFLTKAWSGARINDLTNQMEKFFEVVKVVKPPASRSDSSELFVLGLRFKGVLINQ
ncbi:rRNA methyltransferase 2-like protein [Leptotrombidium deliense]|uniref:rRNA methyltransferase 2, mitochondrial n=1 Tax=Leptotrombidium deliense TaxID=299467 RepID=A0A443SRG2_9ACAR|nr:rRNA methyltransferase 2-like protein [Leptotrombidium deliense]